jgi:hypothetical protein
MAIDTASGPIGPGTPPLVFPQGGIVQKSPHVYLIAWGAQWASDPAGAIPAIQKELGLAATSRWHNILTQYGVTEPAGLVGTFVDLSPLPSFAPAFTAGWDRPFIAELMKAISARGWSNDGDTQFVFLMPAGANLGPSYYCGFHTQGNDASGRTYVYSVIGDQNEQRDGDPARECLIYGLTSLGALESTVSHEYAEAATDPLPFTDPGWTTNDGYEVGDLCEGVPQAGGFSDTSVAINGIEFQELWNNRTSSCAAGSQCYPSCTLLGTSYQRCGGVSNGCGGTCNGCPLGQRCNTFFDICVAR